MDPNIIKENVRALLAQVEQAAPGREVTVVAATKTRTPEEIWAARDAGIRTAGENRVQELAEKLPLGAYDGLVRHFIGHLQTNKVKQVVGNVELIESVDSEHLLEAIDRQAEKRGLVQDVLAEINIGGEEAKSGMAPEELDAFLDFAAKKAHIRVLGLMTVAPKAENDLLCHCFTKMHKLFVDKSRNNCDNIKMVYLSMGMSGDYLQALACGANMIRIGTGIFGPREYAKP